MSVSPVQISRPSFDGTVPVEESAAAAADGSSSGRRSLGALFAIAAAVVVVLGGAGALGLYLTRDPDGTL